jgi:hypothetical protein
VLWLSSIGSPLDDPHRVLPLRTSQTLYPDHAAAGRPTCEQILKADDLYGVFVGRPVMTWTFGDSSVHLNDWTYISGRKAAILNLHERIKNKLFLDRTRKDSNFKRPHICATLFQIEKCWTESHHLAGRWRGTNSRKALQDPARPRVLGMGHRRVRPARQMGCGQRNP